jgi:cell division initiation protein
MHQEFKRAFRGYDTHEVSAFLEVVAETYTELNKKNEELAQRAKLAEQELEQLKNRLAENEKTLQNYKQEMAKIERLMDAKIDSDFIIQKARTEAEKLVSEAKKQADLISAETKFLLDQRSKVAAHLREYLKSQMALLGILAEADKVTPDAPPEVTEQIETIPLKKEPEAEDQGLDSDQTASENTGIEMQDPESIDRFLSDVELDDIPQELAHALSRFKEQEERSEADPEYEAKKKQLLDDLDTLSEHATGMFKKADFHKMLGNDIHKRSEEMINQIYAELEKKKSIRKDNSNSEEPS